MNSIFELWSLSHLSISELGIVLLVGAAFIAGYIDAVAGGGGMIQTLALLMAGVPPVSTLATNKVVSVAGTSMAVVKYARGGAINYYLAGFCIIPCVLAAACGSHIVMYCDDSVITWMIIGCIPIALIVALLPRKQVERQESNSRAKAAASMAPIAFYDGLIGPGTGTYMAITAHHSLGMSFLRATGLAKPLNLATNIGSAVVFILSGKVVWLIAVPMACASIAGAYCGSHSAMKQGDGFIKKIMVAMLIVMLIANIIKAFATIA